MRIFVKTKVIHLESIRYMSLFETKRWLKFDMDQNPGNRDTNLHKIRCINKEVNRRDLLPMTESQKRAMTKRKD